MQEIEIAYRLLNDQIIPPRPIKLQIPGWGGIDHTHKNGSKPQPWHCIPFVEGNTYGLELIYAYEKEQRVTKKDGKIVFSNELSFKCFADNHYGYQAGFDIQIPKDYVLRLEPHPKYFVDETTPCVVPGHLQTEWWTRFFFIVFKAPFEGQTHIFRKGEPYGQILIVPQKINYKIRKQTKKEEKKRANWSALSLKNDQFIGEHSWQADNGIKFNDKYKVLQRIYQKEGEVGLEKILNFPFKKSKMIRKLIRNNFIKKSS